MHQNLSITQRIILCVFFLMMPIAVLLYFFIHDSQNDLEFTYKEIEGSSYMISLVELLGNIGEFQLHDIRVEMGDAPSVEDMKEHGGLVDKAFASLEGAKDTIGRDLQFTLEGLSSRKRENAMPGNVKGKWEALRERAKTAPASALKSEYASLKDDVKTMITHAGDTSNLILDPDLDSYYMMDVVLLGLPMTLDHLSSFGTDLSKYTNDSPVDEAMSNSISVMNYMIAQDAQRVTDSIHTAINEDANFYGKSATLEKNITPALAVFNDQMKALSSTLQNSVASRMLHAEDFQKQLEKVQEASYALWSASQQELNTLLQVRYDDKIHARNNALIALGLALVVALGLFAWVSRSITRPLKGLQETMMEIAGGNLERMVPYTANKDEIGDMARTLEQFKATSHEAIKLQEQQSLATSQRLERQGRVEQKIKEFESKVQELLRSVNNASAQLSNCGGSMVGDAEKVNASSRDTASATNETSETVSAVAAGAEELSAAIQEISRQVSRAASITQEAVDKTASADGTVQALTSSAQKIGEIIGMISNIAEQINLLALNATIESARAGEAGKGFAVVASEVKTLASQTGKAADAIVSQISEMQNVVQRVVQELGQIRVTIDEMNGVSTTIASAVEEQGAATQEIARNIQVASDRVRLVSSNVGEVLQMSENTNQNARQVVQNIDLVSSQSQRLNSEISDFLAGIAQA